MVLTYKAPLNEELANLFHAAQRPPATHNCFKKRLVKYVTLLLRAKYHINSSVITTRKTSAVTDIDTVTVVSLIACNCVHLEIFNNDLSHTLSCDQSITF